MGIYTSLTIVVVMLVINLILNQVAQKVLQILNKTTVSNFNTVVFKIILKK